ncbi:MAG: invasin domain 3-containing protein [Adhaeribacter sp.]
MTITAGACSATAAINVTETPALTASITAPATAFCEGGSVVLTASAGDSWLWSNGATTRAIIADESATYTVVVKTGDCSASASVTVAETPAVVAAITASGSTTFCTGGAVTLTASEGASYKWSNGATTQAITVTTAGSYTVTVTNAAGCAKTSVAVPVTVTPVLAGNAIVEPEPVSFCDQIQLGEIKGSVPVGGTGTYTYQWQTSTNNSTWTNIAAATSKDYTPGLLTRTTYLRRMVTSGTCTSMSNLVKISIVSIQHSTVIADHSVIDADGKRSTAITVILRDSTGEVVQGLTCPLDVSSDLGVIGPVTLKPDGTYSTTLTSSVIPGMATVTAKIGPLQMTAQANVRFAPVAGAVTGRLTASPSIVVADGVAVSVITLQMQDAAGANFTADPAKVEILADGAPLGGLVSKGNGLFEVILGPSTRPMTVALTARYEGKLLNTQADVMFVNRPANGLASLITVSTPTLHADGISTAIVTVTVKDSKGVTLTGGGELVTLTSTEGTLSAVKDNHDGTYTAILTAASQGGMTTISGLVNGQTLGNTVEVTFINRAPLAEEDHFETIANKALEGNMLANDSDPDKDGLVAGLELVKGPVFGTVAMKADGSFVYIPKEGFTGEDRFTYQVCDTDNRAACAEGVVNILVKSGIDDNQLAPEMFIPEGFSPDGDGQNDVFVIYQGAQKFKVSLLIFNRWGNIVYENKDYKNDWDGRAGKGVALGDKLPDGTYFYVIDLNNGEKPLRSFLVIKRK